jgi:crotonobetainyl-CoA:carnitine CoA-transferase CaiB-like acyl-CoA transferase
VVPYGTLYAAKDGKHFVLAIGTDRQFAALAQALGLGPLAEDPRFAKNGARVQHRDALDEILHRAFGAQDSEALERALAAAKVPFGPVNDLTEAFAHPRAQHTALEGTLANGQPFAPSAAWPSRGRFRGKDPAPLPPSGAHTDEVLQANLNYSSEQLAELRAQGVLGASPSTH